MIMITRKLRHLLYRQRCYAVRTDHVRDSDDMTLVDLFLEEVKPFACRRQQFYTGSAVDLASNYLDLLLKRQLKEGDGWHCCDN